MTSLAMSASDTLVLARRNLMRIPRQPDLLIAYTIQPVMFVLLFVYVFGGAIQTPGFDYVDFLMPGIIVQSIAFGGFVTALGLSEDVQKGLIDRFRSLPMSRGAVLAGRTSSDVLLNLLSLVVLLAIGFVTGIALAVACANVLFRDVEHLVSAVLLPWFFLSPIFFRPERLPGVQGNEWAEVALTWLNPVAPFIDATRSVLYDGVVPGGWTLLYVLLAAGGTLCVGRLVFRRLQRELAVVV